MKQMQKIACLLLALLMVLSLGITAFAAEETTQPGSITITNALKGNNMTLYKIFDLESYDKDTNSYQYTIQNDNPLFQTIQDMTIKVTADGGERDEKVFALTLKTGTTDTYYVELTTTFKNAQNDGVAVKSIASQLEAKINEDLKDTNKAQLIKDQLLKAQVTNLGLDNQSNSGTITVEQVTGEGNDQLCNVKFSNLALGYYLVDSSAGAMIGLTTTAPDATMIAKNKHPKAEKEVKRNVDGVWDGANAKSIGEPIEFRVKVSVEDGAKNYVIYDCMSEGLTFEKITKIYYGSPTAPIADNIVYDDSVADKKDMTHICDFVTNASYTTKDGINKTCQFKMTFTQEFLDKILNDPNKDVAGFVSEIYVEYVAKLNEKAVIGDLSNNGGNTNEIYLTYGENDIEVSYDKTTSYSYELELVKHKDDKSVLQGAKFEVYHTNADALAGTNPIHFVKITPVDGGKTVYRVATQTEIGTANTTTTKIEAGDVIIKGLGGSFATGISETGRSYFFKEIEAPKGYTLLPAPVQFYIKKNDEKAVFAADGKYTSGGLGIENRSGNVLPSTGGIGTTIFYVVGSVLLVGAAILLVTKKRMSAEA